MDEKEKEILCKTCICWVDCGAKGFCLCEDLFTYTAKTECDDYVNGEPSTEREFDNI